MTPIVDGKFIPEEEMATTAVAATEPSEAPKGDEVIPEENKSEFFVAVRQRGLSNALLEQAERLFLEKHPDMATRWEYAPPNGDDMMIVAREGQGFRVIQNSELGDSRRPGPVRRGDLVLMAGPKQLVAELAAQDARAAKDDVNASQAAFKASLERTKVITKSGAEDGAKAVGDVKVSTEVRTAFSRQDGRVTVSPSKE